MTTITITYVPEYAHPIWTDQTPREGWTVDCPAHFWLGKDSTGVKWAYAQKGVAEMVATRHGRAKHGGAKVRRVAS